MLKNMEVLMCTYKYLMEEIWASAIFLTVADNLSKFCIIVCFGLELPFLSSVNRGQLQTLVWHIFVTKVSFVAAIFKYKGKIIGLTLY